jgi:hypothetical protein
MDARLLRAAVLAAALVSLGARFKTANFVVDAATGQVAEQVGKAAEKYRHDLAIEWLGKPLPRWAEPCPITVKVAPQLGAGGATSFMFDRGQVYGWRMNIQGSLERVLDSVLPHEVTHTIFASHFRQPLPRWADEGACTTVEHAAERAKQQRMLIDFLKTGRGIPFSRMFAMKEYPPDVLPLYSQGYALAEFLIDRGGKQKYLQYLAEGLHGEQWVVATQKHYGFASLGELQNTWLDWVRQGRPLASKPAAPETTTPEAVAAAPRRERPEPNLIYRAQSEDPPATAGKLVPVRRASSTSAAPTNATPAVSAPATRNAKLGDVGGWRPASPQPPMAAETASSASPAADVSARPPASDSRVLMEWSREPRPAALDASASERGVLRR